mmetsp:Transcript_9715/g.28962  ORF Transcript_9715/g.28962 Transcript_9715/m.28962 type:complete len:294 (+) Transcript_9715:1145-2026(+)
MCMNGLFIQNTEILSCRSATCIIAVLSASLTTVATLRTGTKHLFYNSIERAAMTTLDPQKVPVVCITLCFAVVAHDVYYPLQVTRHRMFCDISCASLPCSCHGLLGYNCLFANGATVIKTGQLAKAMGVDRMATGQILGRLARREHIFSAHWTVIFVFILETPMSLKHIHRNAHTTFGAMPKVLLTTDTAEATLVAMKRFFGLAHPKIAFMAVILSKLNLAIDALIRGRLSRATAFADNFTNQETIHGRMSWWTRLVVTNTTPNNSTTTRSNYVAIPFIVIALDLLLLWHDGS